MCLFTVLFMQSDEKNKNKVKTFFSVISVENRRIRTYDGRKEYENKEQNPIVYLRLI